MLVNNIMNKESDDYEKSRKELKKTFEESSKKDDLDTFLPPTEGYSTNRMSKNVYSVERTDEEPTPKGYSSNRMSKSAYSEESTDEKTKEDG
jgi:hypothetical protein